MLAALKHSSSLLLCRRRLLDLALSLSLTDMSQRVFVCDFLLCFCVFVRCKNKKRPIFSFSLLFLHFSADSPTTGIIIVRVVWLLLLLCVVVVAVILVVVAIIIKSKDEEIMLHCQLLF
jgi:hypothetical protein